jgi:hypothetical protein
LDELLISGVIHSHQGIDVVIGIKCGSPKDDPVDASMGAMEVTELSSGLSSINSEPHSYS